MKENHMLDVRLKRRRDDCLGIGMPPPVTRHTSLCRQAVVLILRVLAIRNPNIRVFCKSQKIWGRRSGIVGLVVCRVDNHGPVRKLKAPSVCFLRMIQFPTKHSRTILERKSRAIDNTVKFDTARGLTDFFPRDGENRRGHLPAPPSLRCFLPIGSADKSPLVSDVNMLVDI